MLQNTQWTIDYAKYEASRNKGAGSWMRCKKKAKLEITQPNKLRERHCLAVLVEGDIQVAAVFLSYVLILMQVVGKLCIVSGHSNGDLCRTQHLLRVSRVRGNNSLYKM